MDGAGDVPRPLLPSVPLVIEFFCVNMCVIIICARLYVVLDVGVVM